MPRKLWIGAAVLAFLPALSVADEGVVIKIRRNLAGDTVKQTRTETETNVAVVTDATGAKITEQKQTKESSSSFTDEIITKLVGKKAAKVRRTYERAAMKTDESEQEVPLGGKTVVIERTAGKSTFKLADGNALPKLAEEFLRSEFKDARDDDSSALDEAILTKTPVKPGDTWKCDVAKLIKEFARDGVKFDAKRSTATGKLVRTYTKDNAAFGVIEVSMSFILTDLGKGGANLTLAKEATMTLTIHFDLCIDGSSSNGKGEVTMNLRALMKSSQNGQDFNIDVVNKRTLTETNQLIKSN